MSIPKEGTNELSQFDSSNASSSSLASITAIARRIQEKNNTLQSERERLLQLQQKLSNLQQEHSIQQKQIAQSRYHLLKETARAANLEMEWMDRCASTEKSKSMVNQHDREIQVLTERLAQIRKECQRDEEEVYAPHLTKITIYQKTLERDLADIRKRKREREEKLASLDSQHQENSTSIKRMKCDKEKIEADLLMMEHEERAEDEEIAALAMQIKATLAKRVSLRSCMEDAKERNRAANEKMIDWENRIMSLSSKK